MLDPVTRTLVTAFRTLRLQAALELTLDWDGPPIYTVGVGEPPGTRAVRCVVRGARRRHVTIVAGQLEVRYPVNGGGTAWTRWAKVAPLGRFVASLWPYPQTT